MEKINNREIEFKVNKTFPNRWSPRAMSGENISDEELMGLFEAARWAPSSRNNQPWRFIYGKSGTDHWNQLSDLLVEFNQTWCKNSSALILVISKKDFEHNNEPSQTHSFDTGAACQNIALQASMNNLVVHLMQGFDYEKAREKFNISKDYTIEVMIAVGKPGKIEDLPETLQEREIPSGRKKVNEMVSEGKFIWD